MLISTISSYVAPESLRMLRRWITEVRADLVSNIVQPGRFTAHRTGPRLLHPRTPAQRSAGRPADGRPPRPHGPRHHRRRARRDREERKRQLPAAAKRQHSAARGEASATRHRRCSTAMPSTCRSSAARRQVVKYSVRERYLWQLISPDPNDPLYKEQPGQFRAELHDRLLAPLYPFAFVLIAFAFLGAPRTTRQSRRVVARRSHSCRGWASLDRFRLHGSRPSNIRSPCWFSTPRCLERWRQASTPFRAGLIIEPPAVLTRAVSAIGRWFARRTGAVAEPAQ